MDELYVFKGQNLIGRYELHATELILGRAGHIVLESPHVSRIHALLSFFPDRGGYVLSDLGSRNGTRVNGKEGAEHPLKNADVIELADFSIRCNFTGDSASTMRAPPIAPREGLLDTQEFKRTAPPKPSVSPDHPAVRAASGRFEATSLGLRKPEPAKKPEEAKKPPEPAKKPDEAAKKPDEKKPDEKKPDEKKPDAKKPDEAAKKPDEKKPEPKKEPAPKREAVGAEVKKVYDAYFKRLRRLARADAEPTKAFATPIQTDLGYPARRHSWRFALRLSWLLAVLLSVGWIGSVFARGRRQVFTSETVSKGHSIFGNRECEKCHTKPFSLEVPDGACLACHDGLLSRPQFEALAGSRGTSFSTHHDNEGHVPPCASCHQEHGGHPILSNAVSDLSCTVCHADLARNISATATLAIVASGGLQIPNLAHHVEFPAVTQPDTAALALNHARHLEPKLPSMESKGRLEWIAQKGRDHLVCADCHEPDASRRWMHPIRFEQHCRKCHEIEIVKDPLLPPESLPHGLEPRVLVAHVRLLGIEADVQKGLEKFIAAHPDELSNASTSGAPPRRGPGPPPKAKALTPEEWLQKKMERWRERGVDGIVDDLLHAEAKNGCAKCHRLEGPDDASRVVPTRVPSRWLPHGLFHHEKHRVVSCAECHPKATTSTKTEDVLIPGIDNCHACHRPQNGASTNCTTCHLYHDRGSERRDMDGRVRREELAPEKKQ